jgi:hypothetical protein
MIEMLESINPAMKQPFVFGDKLIFNYILLNKIHNVYTKKYLKVSKARAPQSSHWRSVNVSLTCG